ncbi:MAG: PKD domain-containing protein [Chthoniobacterales bacterium]
MRIKSTSNSGVFNPRLLLTFVLCAIGASLAVFSWASSPATSTITVPSAVGQTITVTWTGEIPPGANPTSDCTNLADTAAVDQHLPTINVPAGIYNSLNAKFEFNISWDGASGNDEILTVLNPDGSTLDSSDGGDPTETVTGKNLAQGTYKVIACGFTNTSSQAYVGKLTITTTAGGIILPPPIPPTAAAPGVPRYYDFAPPATIGEAAGEPTIGFNKTTKHAMYLAGLQTLQVTFPEQEPPLGTVPEACPADWKDVSFLLTKTKSLDPILFTDPNTGRTFVSQLDSQSAGPALVGLNSLMSFTDDDGATWTPAQVNPPDGSNDHQTVGAGPYPNPIPSGINPVYPDAVYYCGQSGNVLVAASTAFCSRSDDGGLNFGKSVPIYPGSPAPGGCSQLIHGHVKVAPDGTVYVPNARCGGGQAVAVSTDAGTTWTVRTIAESRSGSDDPSVGISKDAPAGSATSNRVYMAWAGPVPTPTPAPSATPAPPSPDNHAFVAYSDDRGVTWSKPYDIGASLGINNAVFPSVVVGDRDRAAVAFLGTRSSGDHQAADFTGTWWGLVAHTYDGGQTWTTVNATPNGPVQREACIWNGGGANVCRNLLDFNDITMDDKGRVLFAFADGCIDQCETGGSNSYSSKATIARQSGGKGLLAAFDTSEPVAPQRACLAGRRDDMASYLNWAAPDAGGSAITQYKIFRATTAPGSEIQIGQQLGDKQTFTDRSVDPSIAKYIYRIVAVNSAGSGLPSNPLELSITPRIEFTGSCSQPGVTAVSDPVGDETDAQKSHDITSVSMAEPISNPNTGAADNIVFTMKVVDLSTVPPDWRWSVRFNVPGFNPPDAPVVGAQEDWFVSMISTDPTNPRFTLGTTGVPQNAARFFSTIVDLPTGPTASHYNADGTITMVLPKSLFQSKAVCTGTCGSMNPGQAINITLGSVRFSPPSEVPGSGGTNETIPDTTGAASYQLRPANLCLPNTAPFARLTEDVHSGVASLTVHFDGSGSSDPDAIDTIGSYTFNFGDGNDDVVQNSAAITHTFTQPGLYAVRLVVTDSRGKVSSNTDLQFIEVNPVSNPSAAQLLNISSRLKVQTGDNILIGGFIVTGTDPKKVGIRAIGPSTKVPGFLADPTLELYDSHGALIVSNDNWMDAPERAQIEAVGLTPGDPRESAILHSLDPGAYTAVIRGKNNSTGISLVEAFDLDANNNSRLANLSTRGLVETGDNVLIGGFITGNRLGNINVLIRAIGPSLANQVANPLSDPILELHDSNGTTVATNDNWQDDQAADIQQTGLAPANAKESAILASLQVGSHTAIVRGVNGNGNALVEVYNLP